VRYDLATLTRRVKPGTRRKSIIIRDIAPPAMLATDLYRSSYLPVVEAWGRAIPGIVEEYERTLSAIITDSAEDIQSRLDAASSDLERLFILLDGALRDWAVRVESWSRGKWRGAVLSATGVDISTLIGPEDMRETLGSYLAWNSGLVRDVSAQIRQRISNAVFSGLQNRTPVREVAKQINEATALGRDRSKRIASDQLSKVSNALADERRREAGLTIWKWRWSHKKHGRPEHIARDGKLYSEVAADVGQDVEGQTVNAAPDASDLPGRPPYCGCRSQACLILD
jgi:hypothetical protein